MNLHIKIVLMSWVSVRYFVSGSCRRPQSNSQHILHQTEGSTKTKSLRISNFLFHRIVLLTARALKIISYAGSVPLMGH
jgi:hypothetical protein